MHNHSQDELEKSKYVRFLAYVLVLYYPFFLFINLLRLWGFGFSMEDIGIFHQVIWNSANGDWFQTSMKYPFNEDSSWLGFHFSILPIIATLPFYKLYPHIETLCFVHIAVVCVISIVIFKTCIKLGLKAGTSFFWSLIYLFNPVTIYHAMFSFQETTFSTLLISLGIYFCVTKNFRAILVITFLQLITKEHLGMSVFGFGVLWYFLNKSKAQALALCVIGFLGFVLVVFVFVPHFSPLKEHFMLATNYGHEDYQRYQWLKQPMLEVVKQAPEVIFSKRNFLLFGFLLFSFAFMPLGAIIFLFPLAADFVTIVLSDSPIQKYINYYYSAPFIPAMVIASAYFIKNGQKASWFRKKAKYFLLVYSFILLTMVLAVPVYKFTFISDKLMDWTFKHGYHEAVSLLPKDKMIFTDQFAGQYISARRKVARFDGSNLAKADYIFVRINPYNYSVTMATENHRALWIASEMAKYKEWGLIYFKYPYIIFQKGVKDKANRDLMFKNVDFYMKQNDMPKVIEVEAR